MTSQFDIVGCTLIWFIFLENDFKCILYTWALKIKAWLLTSWWIPKFPSSKEQTIVMHIDAQNYSSEENAKLSSFARKLSGWTDAFSRAFIRQWPKRHIDNQDQSQFVSREESEYRLLLLFISFSLISCIVTTGLLISCSFNCINKDTITLYPRQQPSKYSHGFWN